jgi:toxin HigB-1
MRLVRFRHKGLRRLYADNYARGVPPAMVDKLRKLLFALETGENLDQVGRFPGWKLHPLKGTSKGGGCDAHEEPAPSGRPDPNRDP